MLRLLSLLQQHRHWPGDELAERLEVSPRTLRRDVDRLRQLGYPVESARGVDGGYELAAGANLPPLLLDEEEAIALAAGLQGVAHSAHPQIAEASVSALAKVVAMLPAAARRRIELVGEVTVGGEWRPRTAGVSPEVLGRVAQACRDTVRLRFQYVAQDGVTTERYVEPYRMVTLASRWYLLAFDIDRDDWRTFRVDRVAAPEPMRNAFDARPLPAGDLAAYVRGRIETIRNVHHVEVVVDAPPDRVREVLGRWVTIEASDDSTRTTFTMDVDSLDWPVLALASFGADFEVITPPELTTRVKEIAQRFTKCA
jgi:predicted DNA-binding transcriptional regulator YafY